MLEPLFAFQEVPLPVSYGSIASAVLGLFQIKRTDVCWQYLTIFTYDKFGPDLSITL